jgi:membrane associated rhomboid family serine protease
MNSRDHSPPPYDDGPRGGNAQFVWPSLTPMVKHLLKINAIVFLLSFVVYLAPGNGERLVVDALGLHPGIWRDFFPFVPVWQLFTYGFLHDMTTLGHLVMNMLMLYFFGTMLEGLLGARRFLVTYLGAMLAGAVLHLGYSMAIGSSAPAIGASGAVLGVVVATAVMRPNTRVILIFIPISLKVLAIGIVVFDVFNLVVGLKSGASDGVAHFVHLGGIVYGFVAVKRGWVWIDPLQRFQARRAISSEEKRQGDVKRVDELLEKIHKHGLNSLSTSEKSFLKRVSARDE